MSKATGLYIGRFQPFHRGHLSAVKQALKKVDKLIIAIGSAQAHQTAENPFSEDERTQMIQLSLSENRIPPEKFHIIALPDINNNDQWPGYVKKSIPRFNTLFVGNTGIVKVLFEAQAPEITIRMVQTERPINATTVRQKMSESKTWEKEVSPSVARYLHSIKGDERVKNLMLIKKGKADKNINHH